MPILKRHALSPTRAAALAAALVAAWLAGCSMQDEEMARFMVAPGKFELFSCAQLAERTKTDMLRERELQALIQKAGPQTGGRLVSAMAYRPEYLTIRGELQELRAVAIAKKCKALPSEPTPDRLSDTIIR